MDEKSYQSKFTITIFLGVFGESPKKTKKYSLPLKQKGVYHLRMDNKDIIPRIGTFFLVLGIGSTLLFVISDTANAIKFNYLFIGLFFSGIGISLRRKAEKTPPSGRFGWWKSLKDKDKKEKKDK